MALCGIEFKKFLEERCSALSRLSSGVRWEEGIGLLSSIIVGCAY